jgi:probable DNA metabolism protein
LAAPLALPAPSEKEQQYQALWQQFYRALTIEARRNEACRRNLCPKRYWADMTELRGKL